MGTITNMQVAAFTLVLLGIVSSLLVDSNKTGLQRLLSLDGGFSETVDEAFGFRISVRFTSIVHIWAHASLLYGAIESKHTYIVVYLIYFIITNLLCALAVWFVPSYEYLLYLWPMESVPILYAQSVTLALCVFFTRTFLAFYIFKEAAKPAPLNKMDDDKVSVTSV